MDISCGKGSGGSGLLLLLQWFLEDILVVGFKSNQAVEAFIWFQDGLASPDQVTINSGEDLLSRSFKGWSKITPEAQATPVLDLLHQGWFWIEVWQWKLQHRGRTRLHRDRRSKVTTSLVCITVLSSKSRGHPLFLVA